MKKILIFVSIISLFITSCQPTEVKDAFNETAEQRSEASITNLKSDLVNSKDGWLSTYIFDGGRESVVMHIVFKGNNRAVIDIISDSHLIKDDPELKHMESSFTVNYTQQLDLVFDTYSTFAKFVDMKLGGDFRWELLNKGDETYTFASREERDGKKGTLTIEKYTEERKEEALRKQEFISHLMNDQSISYFRTLEITKPSVHKFDYKFTGRKVTLIDENGDVYFSSIIDVTDDGFKFVDPLVIDGVEITHFVLDDNNIDFDIANEGVEGGIYYSATPAHSDFDRYDRYMNLVFYRGLMCYDLSSKDFRDLFDKVEKDLKSDPDLAKRKIQIQSFYILDGDIRFFSGPYDNPNESTKIAQFKIKTIKKDGQIEYKLVGDLGVNPKIDLPDDIQLKINEKIKPIVDQLTQKHVFLFHMNFIYDICSFISGDPATTNVALFGLEP